MTFQQVFDQLYQQEKIVEYQSLTSEKIHKMRCTVPRKFQSDSNKIVVLNLKTNKFHDIEISTIISIAND
jgi:hypothetical protein